jgi:hypothetical protein
MYIYQVWCDIESGSKSIHLEVESPPFAWEIIFNDGFKAKAKLLLCNGKNALITIVCDRDVVALAELFQAVVCHVQALYDATLFKCGISSAVYARAAILPNGQMANIIFNDVNNVIDQDALGLSIEQITKCAIQSGVVRMCLSDLRNASLNIHDAGMLCYRAIEAIMQDFKESEDEESKITWPKVRSSLRFDKSFVEPVNKHSISNRHGKMIFLSAENARDIIQRSLLLVGRYSRSKILGLSIADEQLLK